MGQFLKPLCLILFQCYIGIINEALCNRVKDLMLDIASAPFAKKSEMKIKLDLYGRYLKEL